MPNSVLRQLFMFLTLGLLLALPACGDTPDDDDDASDDDDTADDDDSAGDDDDSAPPPPPPPPGNTLCASGGPVSGNGITGVICTGPVDLASGATATSADGSIVWHPGPIRRIAAP
jgi:hypothetical protein